MSPLFKTLRHFSEIGRSRTSSINPLQWVLVLLMFGLLAAIGVHGDVWILKFFVGSISIIVLLIVAAYIFFMVKDPDALRSETFSLAKTAIEKQMLGDNLSGLREVVDILEGPNSKLLGSGTQEEKPR
jgi:hypothetical protein